MTPWRDPLEPDEIAAMDAREEAERAQEIEDEYLHGAER